jgi:hypothetical protein
MPPLMIRAQDPRGAVTYHAAVAARSLITLVLILTLAACGGGESTQPSRSASAVASTVASAEASASAPAGETVSVFDLKTGDCFNSAAEGTVEEVERIDCAAPHTYEIFAAVDHPGGSSDAYPGDVAMASFAGEQCRAEFEPFIGLDYDSSELFIFYLHPSAETWPRGDREVLCTVYSEDGPLEGSMEGANR